MKAQTEQMDKALLEEKGRTVTEIVKTATKKVRRKKTTTDKLFNKEEQPISKYMATIQKKGNINKARLKNLRLLPNTLPPEAPKVSNQKTKENKMYTPRKNSPRKQVSTLSDASNPEKVSINAKKKADIKKRKRTVRNIFEDSDIKKMCTYDHKDMSMYKEEMDERYFNKENELYDTYCTTCGVEFVGAIGKDDEAVYVSSTANPTYFCTGRRKFNCNYGHCKPCYLKQVQSICQNRSRRCR